MANTMELMNKLSEDDIQHCYEQWTILVGQRRDRGVEYIEGNNISVVYFFN
jgi:hypothetical protein